MRFKNVVGCLFTNYASMYLLKYNMRTKKYFYIEELGMYTKASTTNKLCMTKWWICNFPSFPEKSKTYR
jgi:hypothetical protein